MIFQKPTKKRHKASFLFWCGRQDLEPIHSLRSVADSSETARPYEKYAVGINPTAYFWCGRQDLNLHTEWRKILNLMRLPIPPRPHINFYIRDPKSYAVCFRKASPYLPRCFAPSQFRHTRELNNFTTQIPFCQPKKYSLFPFIEGF